MEAPKLRVREGFNWRRVAWGKPDSPVRSLCCYCHGALPKVPLMLWREDGSAIAFCDACRRVVVDDGDGVKEKRNRCPICGSEYN